ncbi:MAG: SH3 domain-containing protein, partial [Rhodobacteraceae bacterium]|nr:SH3 domain-containing protein [Paracoccaceae bacterium]
MTRLHLIFTALAAIFTILLTPMAMATDAKATAWVNVRSGPGTGYGVVDTMAPGEVGNMTECRSNGWCYIQRSGPDGWVSSSYLTAAEPESSDPNCRVRLVIGPGGPRFVISCDDGGSGVDVVVP